VHQVSLHYCNAASLYTARLAANVPQDGRRKTKWFSLSNFWAKQGTMSNDRMRLRCAGILRGRTSRFPIPIFGRE
jgi:hypothetical protein